MWDTRNDPDDVGELLGQPTDCACHPPRLVPQGCADLAGRGEEHPTTNRPPKIAVDEIGQEHGINQRPPQHLESILRADVPPRVHQITVAGWRNDPVYPRAAGPEPGWGWLTRQRDSRGDHDGVLRLRQRDGVIRSALGRLRAWNGHEDSSDLGSLDPLATQVADQVSVSA